MNEYPEIKCKTMNPVMGIDPGPVESAYVVWDGACILEHGKHDNAFLRSALRDIGYCEPRTVVIEKIASYGMPVGAEVFETCVWTGRFIEACGQDNRITRKAVCSHICGSAKAKDSNIRQALIDRVGPAHTKETYTPVSKSGQPLKPRERTADGPTAGITKDEWAALAVAVTWWDLHGGE
jgi:hypothetical protein